MPLQVVRSFQQPLLMIVVNFIIGLAIVLSIVGILYGVGLLSLKISDEYDESPDFIEIIVHGLIGLALIGILLLVSLLIYLLGEYVAGEVTKLITELKSIGGKVSDKVTKIKLAETIANIRKIKSAKKIKEQHLSAMMMTYELLSELKQSIKK